jgi:hypothetical protein
MTWIIDGSSQPNSAPVPDREVSYVNRFFMLHIAPLIRAFDNVNHSSFQPKDLQRYQLSKSVIVMSYQHPEYIEQIYDPDRFGYNSLTFAIPSDTQSSYLSEQPQISILDISYDPGDSIDTQMPSIYTSDREERYIVNVYPPGAEDVSMQIIVSMGKVIACFPPLPSDADILIAENWPSIELYGQSDTQHISRLFFAFRTLMNLWSESQNPPV